MIPRKTDNGSTDIMQHDQFEMYLLKIHIVTSNKLYFRGNANNKCLNYTFLKLCS